MIESIFIRNEMKIQLIPLKRTLVQIIISFIQNGGKRPPTIAEDNEGNPHSSVSRTITQMDPEGKAERDDWKDIFASSSLR